MNPIAAGLKAGWISFPVEVKAREMSRNLAQPAEAFDSGLAYRLWDNGASHSQIARAVGCSRRGVGAVIEHGRNNR